MTSFNLNYLLRGPVSKYSHTWGKVMGFPGGSDGKESTCNAGDLGSIFGLGRSPGKGNGCPLQCSGLENLSMGLQRIGHDGVWILRGRKRLVHNTRQQKSFPRPLSLGLHGLGCIENKVNEIRLLLCFRMQLSVKPSLSDFYWRPLFSPYILSFIHSFIH